MATKINSLSISLDRIYNVKSNKVPLERFKTISERVLECFPSPGKVIVKFPFPEFTCRCPRTGHPDFATVTLMYIPREICVELKSLKYYFNSFRDEGHFHEQVIVLIEKDLRDLLNPVALAVIGKFNTRGGISPTVECGDVDAFSYSEDAEVS